MFLHYRSFKRPRKGHFRAKAGMTLVEVMVAMLVITGVAMAVFMTAKQSSQRALVSAYRAEAYRIAQRISEHAMTLPLSSFTPTGVKTSDPTGTPMQWVWTDTEASEVNLSLKLNTSSALAYPTTGGPVVFTKTITTGTSPGVSTVLNIAVSWTFVGRNYNITVPSSRGL